MASLTAICNNGLDPSGSEASKHFNEVVDGVTSNADFFKILFEIEHERKTGGKSLYEIILKNINRLMINFCFDHSKKDYTVKLIISNNDDQRNMLNIKTAEESELFELETKATIDLN